MEERYKSLASVRPEAWISHFRSTVGKPTKWNEGPKLRLVKPNSPSSGGGGGSGGRASSDLPLNVVSPIEQYSEMAQATVSKTGPKYNAPSVSGRQRRGKHSAKRRAKSKSKEGDRLKKKKRQRKGEKDIFSD